MGKVTSVDEFIAKSVPESQSTLIELRKMIKAAFTDVEESMGDGVPQYKFGNRRIGLSVAKNHVTIGFDYGVISDEQRKNLEKKGYKLGLQTLQIKFTQDIPMADLQNIFNFIV